MFCGALSDYMALTDDVGMFTDIQSFPHIVICNQHTNTTVAQMANNILNIIDRDGVNSSEGLIQQNKTVDLPPELWQFLLVDARRPTGSCRCFLPDEKYGIRAVSLPGADGAAAD